MKGWIAKTPKGEFIHYTLSTNRNITLRNFVKNYTGAFDLSMRQLKRMGYSIVRVEVKEVAQ